ncbi:MAG: hypothetical protein FWC94_04015 [Bacteroidales bacterium]|nr:hypothetical protein [Bacteroidales bacterium]
MKIELQITEAKEKIKKVLSADKDTSRGLVKETILPVSEKEAKILSGITGLDITTQYKHVVDKSGLNHAFGEHGHDSEKLRGQRKLTENDVLRIPEVITSYDSVKIPLNSKGEQIKSAQKNTIIQYEKTFDDGTTYYVEEVRTGKKEFALATMWIKEKGKV